VVDTPQSEIERGRVHDVCASKARGMKYPVGRVRFERDLGIPGDVHAGPGNRQIAVLAWEWTTAFAAETGIPVEPGCFAENLSIEGLDLDALALGARLRVGEALLEVAERGKAEWKPGDYSFHGKAILAERGLFCRVLESGWVASGDAASFVESESLRRKRDPS
jgi:MOSC domain-containing protein YiiM